MARDDAETCVKKKKPRRLVPHRDGGLINRDAPYWKGERAEAIVKARVTDYFKKKTRKKT